MLNTNCKHSYTQTLHFWYHYPQVQLQSNQNGLANHTNPAIATCYLRSPHKNYATHRWQAANMLYSTPEVTIVQFVQYKTVCPVTHGWLRAFDSVIEGMKVTTTTLAPPSSSFCIVQSTVGLLLCLSYSGWSLLYPATRLVPLVFLYFEELLFSPPGEQGSHMPRTCVAIWLDGSESGF